MSIWDAIPGNRAALDLLRQDVHGQRVAHAYLFSGAAGRIPRSAAEAFSSALVCPGGGCATCERCRAVSVGVHPDVEVIEPPGMQLLVEQVREAVRVAWRMPSAGARRVIVVDRADRMNPNAQNAFLKALEEPPPSTTIILVAGSSDALLETVRSRCREVQFQAPDEADVADILRQRGVGDDDAARWARLGGSLERALRLATDEQARSRRDEVVEMTLRVARDPGEALEAAERVAERTREMRDVIAETHREVAAEHAEWLKETKKAVDDRLRREQRRAEQEALDAALDDITAVLRDLLVVAHEPEGPVLDPHIRSQLVERAGALGPRTTRGALGGLAAVEEARRRLASNANVLLTLEQVFLALHQRLTPAG